MRKKNSLTLIEVILAVGIFSLLSCLLLTYYIQTESFAKVSYSTKRMALEHASCMHQLKVTLGQLVIEDGKKTNVQECQFFTDEKKRLVFTYDNGVDRDPKYSGKVLGKLYIQGGSLILKTSPLTSPKESRKQVLLSHVLSCEFQFYTPPKKRHFEVDPNRILDEIEAPEGVLQSWEKTFQEIPQSIYIVVEQKIGNEVFFFEFPQMLYIPVLYPRNI